MQESIRKAQMRINTNVRVSNEISYLEIAIGKCQT